MFYCIPEVSKVCTDLAKKIRKRGYYETVKKAMKTMPFNRLFFIIRIKAGEKIPQTLAENITYL